MALLSSASESAERIPTRGSAAVTSGSHPCEFCARMLFYHLLSPKGGAKSVREAPPSGSFSEMCGGFPTIFASRSSWALSSKERARKRFFVRNAGQACGVRALVAGLRGRRLRPVWRQSAAVSRRQKSATVFLCTFGLTQKFQKVKHSEKTRVPSTSLAERAQKTTLFCTPAPGVRTAVRSVSDYGALRRLRCAARKVVLSLAGRSPA